MPTKMNLPCWITVSRLLLLPAAVISASLQWRYGLVVAAAICLIAGITDILDGRIARRTNSTTQFGANLDLLADKIFVPTMLVLLAYLAAIPFWVPLVVISREVVVSILRRRRSRVGLSVAPDRLGKSKMVISMVAIILLLLQQDFRQSGVLTLVDGSLRLSVLVNVAWWTMLLAVGLTVLSAMNYAINYSKVELDEKIDFAHGKAITST